MVRLQDIIGVPSLAAVNPSDFEGKTPLKYSSGKAGARYFNSGSTKNIYVIAPNGRLGLVHFRFDNADKNNFITYRYNDFNDDCIEQHSNIQEPYITIVIDTAYTMTITSPKLGLVYINANDDVKLYE